MRKISYIDLNNLLLKINHLSFYQKLIKILNYRLNTPYKRFPFKKEKLNTIPFFPVRHSDCVSFVLTSIAIVVSKSIMQAKLNMIPFHYKNNFVSYETRFHFTEDRILYNKYFKNISNEIGNINNLNLFLNKKEDGSKLIDINYQKKINIEYLSIKSFIAGIDNIIYPVVNISFCRINNTKNGHFISHEGFLVNKKYLFHSSYTQKKVVKVDIKKYIEKYNWDGIIISKIEIPHI